MIAHSVRDYNLSRAIIIRCMKRLSILGIALARPEVFGGVPLKPDATADRI